MAYSGQAFGGKNRGPRQAELTGVERTAAHLCENVRKPMDGQSRIYFLSTDRLRFSRWTEDDLDLAIALWGDLRVSRFLGGPFTPEQVRMRLKEEIERMNAFGLQYWPVFLKQNGDLAGCAGLRPYGTSGEVLELGFHFRPQYWGQGFAREAANAVIALAFESLAVKSVFAGHHPENAASERLLRKLGFRYTHQEIYPPTGLLNPAYALMNPTATRR